MKTTLTLLLVLSVSLPAQATPGRACQKVLLAELTQMYCELWYLQQIDSSLVLHGSDEQRHRAANCISRQIESVVESTPDCRREYYGTKSRNGVKK